MWCSTWHKKNQSVHAKPISSFSVRLSVCACSLHLHRIKRAPARNCTQSCVNRSSPKSWLQLQSFVHISPGGLYSKGAREIEREREEERKTPQIGGILFYVWEKSLLNIFRTFLSLLLDPNQRILPEICVEKSRSARFEFPVDFFRSDIVFFNVSAKYFSPDRNRHFIQTTNDTRNISPVAVQNKIYGGNKAVQKDKKEKWHFVPL